MVMIKVVTGVIHFVNILDGIFCDAFFMYHGLYLWRWRYVALHFSRKYIEYYLKVGGTI
jgi:hypothetical protein